MLFLSSSSYGYYALLAYDSTSLFLDIGNNNGNFLRPTVKKLSIISKIDDEDIVGIRLYVFTYKKLENATDCFSKNKLLSKGRFGEVYIGYIEFTIVTIKKFTSIDISGKQEDVFEEIKDIGSSVQHRNLVNLIGYCDDGFNKLLVYEFVHKESSLRCHLHGMSYRKSPLLLNTNYNFHPMNIQDFISYEDG